jgi:Superfamily II DNA/RNA helicases, SNF2 family
MGLSLEKYSIKSDYTSYDDDLAKSFFLPVIGEAIRYDRSTAYFSARALALYSRGLEKFGQKKDSRFRLLVSTEIESKDYDEMKKGYELRKEISEELLSKLREELTLSESRNISNLAYLISLGIVDVKMAFTKRGIYHTKFGIVFDDKDNVIYFTGSSNETEAGLQYNFESLSVDCSWWDGKECQERIYNNVERFEKQWTGNYPGVVVRNIDEILYQEIQKHNRGHLIFFDNNFALLDIKDGVFILDNNIESSYLDHNSWFMKWTLGGYIDAQIERKTIFKPDLVLSDLKKIKNELEEHSRKNGFNFVTTPDLEKYIALHEMNLSKRKNVGLSIKTHAKEIFPQYEEFKSIVDASMSRSLRDRQMWDAFYMTTMKKSGNFSVPGSGKTASVYGMFAFLKYKKLVKRIVMVGPKNSFNSWIDEFISCFGDKEELREFNPQTLKFNNTREMNAAFKIDTGSVNLLLFNYESLHKYKKSLIDNIIDEKTILVFDEVHRVKAVNGQWASIALSVAKNATYVVALTGTPIPNSYLDLYNILNILYPHDYKEFFGYGEKQLSAPTMKEIKDINDSIQPFFCRTTKSQLNVPPPNNDSIVFVSPSNEELALFEAIKYHYRYDGLALIIRILQAESDPSMLQCGVDDCCVNRFFDDHYSNKITPFKYDGVVPQITTKTKECISLIKKLVKEGKNVIVWCIFVKTIENLETFLSKEGITVKKLYGSTDDLERTNIINEFKSKKIQVLLTNPHTLAESVSLHTACHDAIYYEYSYNLVHLLQSKDRIHRLGLESDQYTQYHFLQQTYDLEFGEYSLDKAIYERLCEKEQIMNEAIEGNKLEMMTTDEEDIELILGKLFKCS